MKRRHVPKYSSLTSLLDVLFILMFASLAQAAALVERAREQPPTDKRSPADSAHTRAGTEDAGMGSAPDAGASDGSVAAPSIAVDAGTAAGTPKQKFHDQAIAVLMRTMQRRRPIYVNVSRDGVLQTIEYLDGIYPKKLDVVRSLLRRVPDPNIEWTYVGDADDSAQICRVVRDQLKIDDLDNDLIIIVPEVPLSELNNALVGGMRRDQARCGGKGIAVLVDPASGPAPQAPVKQP